MTSVGIIGASGFTGAELLRLCAEHPDLDVRLATGDTQAGSRVADLYPSLAAGYADLAFEPYDPDGCDGLDLVFLGLPHGASQDVVPELRGRGRADRRPGRRLPAAATPPSTPGGTARSTRPPSCSPTSSTACPSCSATASPAPRWSPPPAATSRPPSSPWRRSLRAGLVEPTGIVVDAASGVSGAGRPAKPTTAFCTVDEDFTAYGLLDHRHTPEIEQGLGDVAGTDVRCCSRPTSPR